jgi:signal transduction histidine kinase
MSGLQLLATEIASLHGVHAAFDCAKPVEISDPGAANHLYRIAQEAMQNALRHGQPRSVIVRLHRDGPHVCMEVEDDGKGMPRKGSGNPHGIGLRTMKFRADAMGGFLQVLHPVSGGTLIRCHVPLAQDMPQQSKLKRSRPGS